jgi:phage tail-like protein
MAYASDDLVSNHRFVVNFGKGKTVGFRKVSGLKVSMALEYLPVGGDNNNPAFTPKRENDPDRLTLERGKFKNKMLKDLAPGTMFKEGVTIELHDDDGDTVAAYATGIAVVESIEIGDLDALDGSVLIEKFVIVHSGLTQRK